MNTHIDADDDTLADDDTKSKLATYDRHTNRHTWIN